MNIDKYLMALGYQEMASINLNITRENFHLETEGAKLGYEMGTKETKDKTK